MTEPIDTGIGYEDLIESLGLIVFICLLTLMLKILKIDQPIADEATSEIQALSNVTSTRSSPGLLDLPPELRVIIFHHLLVDPNGVDLGWLSTQPRPPLDILRTSRLIYGEAFEVFYRENRFLNFLGTMERYLPSFANTIQNIHVEVTLFSIYLDVKNFLKFMPQMGNPSITHDTLTVNFSLDGTGSSWFNSPRWFVRALGRFTNFRTIELRVSSNSSVIPRKHIILRVLKYLKLSLEPVLGDAEDSSREGYGLLRFHPLDHRNRLREELDGDWADSLNGIRLEWDEDSTNANDFKTLG